jgi:hypothetical protein
MGEYLILLLGELQFKTQAEQQQVRWHAAP